MHNFNRAHLLGEMLKNVSRSFFLTLRILPAGLREPIGLAYLLARTADTIADTSLIPPTHRLELLLSFRANVNGLEDKASLSRLKAEIEHQHVDSHEKALLASVEPMLALLATQDNFNCEAIRQTVTTLTMAMEFDLRTFPDEFSGRIVALETLEELDHYTYLVAGCVGEFWTKITYMHQHETRNWDVKEMLRRGVRFGKALQMTNILRDCGKDLRIGRCYLPANLLNQCSLCPEDLLLPEASLKAKPLLIDLVRQTLEHFREATNYTLAIPRRCIRLRLACLWPILIGLETLLLLVNNRNWLDPQCSSKIKRSKIYRIMVCSLPVIGSNILVERWIKQLMVNIEAHL